MPSSRGAASEGVVYTEYAKLKGVTPIGSLWSFQSARSASNRPVVARNAEGDHEFWLDRSDPLLNTILPGTGASVIVNFADRWSVGSLSSTGGKLPPVFVVGPVLRPRTLRVGDSVRAIGAAFPAIHTPAFLGIRPSHLLDRIVPLDTLWPIDDVERMASSLRQVPTTRAVAMLRDALMTRGSGGLNPQDFAQHATQLIRQKGGRVSINELARTYGLSRQKFARRFVEAAGVPPKLYARITRFQFLLRRLLTSDVSQWVAVSSEAGFYDQAHMINEFRKFAGVAPIEFFRPRGDAAKTMEITVRGRPSEWRRRSSEG